MLDIKFVRENANQVRQAIRAKQLHSVESKLDELLHLDEEYRLLRSDLEEKQARRNAESKRIGELKRRGEDAEALIRETGRLSDEVKRLEERSRSLGVQIEALMLELPNLPHESVPYGESEHDNVIVKEWGEKPSFAFTPKPHWELAAQRGWLDLEAGVKIAGAGFPVFKGDGARLVRSLVQYFLNALQDHGFIEVAVPYLVNAASATATGQLPDKEGQMYQVTDGFYLIPTSEVSIANLHRDEILDEAQLPRKYAGHSPCFRREAGSYGKEVRGINRVHQFDKVEMIVFSRPEESFDALEEMTAIAEGLLEALGLPYRRLLMCTGDMGFTQAKKYDLEVWSAGQERWLEVSSISNVTDFQARRLLTRYRSGGAQGKGKPELVHTLNGSALALPRTVAAIIENFQQQDGTVAVPEVVRPYYGKLTMG
jgi:seryl-tRNA synthetase